MLPRVRAALLPYPHLDRHAYDLPVRLKERRQKFPLMDDVRQLDPIAPPRHAGPELLPRLRAKAVQELPIPTQEPFRVVERRPHPAFRAVVRLVQ